MGVSPIQFNGRDLYIPGYYAKRNISSLDIGAATGSRFLLLGECRGGIPFDAESDYPNAEDRINWVTNSEEVDEVLMDGAARNGALFALTPSNDPNINGASAVGVIRMNSATRSSSVIKNIDLANSITLKSLGYGVFTTQIRRKIISGTIKGKNLTVRYGETVLNTDNVTKELLTIQYIGNGTSCALTLDPAGNLTTTVVGGTGIPFDSFEITYIGEGSACGLTLTQGGNLVTDVTAPGVGEVELDLVLANYASITALIAAIEANPSYTVELIGSGSTAPSTLDDITVGDAVDLVSGAYIVAGTLSENLNLVLANFETVQNLVLAISQNASYSVIVTGDSSFQLSKLDKIISGDNVNISTQYTIKAVCQAVIDWFNSSGIVTAELYGVSARRAPNNDSDYVFLAGGTDGSSPSQQDWQDALDNICAKVDASFVGVMTANAAVHAALSAHITYMSGVDGRNERQAAVGSADGDTDAVKIAAAAAINNSMVAYCATEIKRYDKNGELQTWPGFYRAAQFLGMASGNPITMSHTNKQINVVGVKEVYSTTQKNNFIKGGVVVDSPSPLGGVRCVRSVSSYQGSNLIANEFSVMRTILFITKDHRTFVEGLIGDAGDPTNLESVKNRALTRLDYYVEQGWLVTDPNLGNAFRNFTFNVQADKVLVSYEGTVVVPINFVLVNHNFTVIGIRK